ncbi:hypothetical protein X943_002512 [Babesia divergens]|uniref:Cell cycle checkpoint control protein RAD9A n=1 Tax=Babesia divergens TaxID=32595 RepID=A0AAD9G7C3_BABDI|nr:hypothetical protein X943_002512 [Babesia divergens]
MEYELNASHTLLLKKIFILFRHVSSNVQIVATLNGLNLYALNGSNSAWLHIQLGKQFFRRIDCPELEDCDSDEPIAAKYWVVASKNLCQALSIVTPAGPKNQGYCAVFLKDVAQGDDNTVRTPVALEKLVIREEREHGYLLSFVLNCAGEHIQRSAIISYEEFKICVPDDIKWSNWHYLRIQPNVLYKSINPYWSPFDDIAISYNPKRDELSLSIVKSIVRSSGRSKSRSNKRAGISGKITINSSHFVRLLLDEELPPPQGITISLKELLSLTSFCESVKAPLSLLMRNPGDPVVVIFGEAVDIVESTTGEISIHQVIADAAAHYAPDHFEALFLGNQNRAWSGALWLSSIQPGNSGHSRQVTQPESEAESQIIASDVKERTSNLDPQPQSSRTADLFKDPLGESSDEEIIPSSKEPTQLGNLSRIQRDLIYKCLALDFMPASSPTPSKGGDSFAGISPRTSEYIRTDEASIDTNSRDRDDIVYDQLAGIW